MKTNATTAPAETSGNGRAAAAQNGRPAPPPTPAQTAPGKDPRYIALRNFAISLTVFNILGYTLLGFEQPWLWPFIAVGTAYVLELSLETIAAWGEGRPPAYRGRGFRGLYEFLLPPHITALAVNFLLYANDRILPVLLAVSVAIGGKWILRAKIRGRSKHFMNPSNFGITIALLLFTNISIAPPYHFVENVTGTLDWAIPAIIVTAGTFLNAKLTHKMPMILAWLGVFALQAVVRGLFTDVSILSALSPMVGVAFVLFTNYMITDPATSPFGKRDQIVFGASVGVVYGLLTGFHVVYGLFFAVTIVCLARGVYWWVRSGREWFQNRQAAAVAATTSPAVATVNGTENAGQNTGQKEGVRT